MKNFCKNIRVTFSKYSMCNLIFLNLVTRKWKSKTLPYQFAFAQTVFKHLKYYNKTIAVLYILLLLLFFSRFGILELQYRVAKSSDEKRRHTLRKLLEIFYKNFSFELPT